MTRGDIVTTATQDVMIPCRRFDVDITIGGDDGLGLIDQFVLRTIVTGGKTVESIAAALNLSVRIVFDSVMSLMTSGWVIVSGDGTLDVASLVREAMGDPEAPVADWHRAFESRSPANQRPITVTQDLVSGSVFIAKRTPWTERESLPFMPRGPLIAEPEQLSPAVLVPVVMGAMREPSPKAARQDLVGIPPGFRLLGLSVRRKGAVVVTRPLSLQATIETTSRGDREPPQIVIVAPTSLPHRVRRAITDALEQSWERQVGRQYFFDKLRSGGAAAEEAEIESSSPIALLRELEGKIARLDDGDADARDHLHRELRAVDDELTSLVEQMSAMTADLQVIIGRSAVFQDMALDGIRSAQRQVVVASPWLGRLARDRRWCDEIAAAVARGVAVVICWGIDHGEQRDLPFDLTTAIEDLRRRTEFGPGTFVMAKRGSNSHAKAVICDLDWALVSSCNFLSADPSRAAVECGLRISFPDPHLASSAVVDILRWIERLLPDYQTRGHVLMDPMHFGRRDDTGALVSGPAQMDPPQASEGPMRDLATTIWRDGWRRRWAWLETATAAALRAALPVTDAEHRHLLVRAVAGARQRLGIMSHTLRTHGLSERLRDLIGGAAERRVDVRLVIGADDEATADEVARARISEAVARGAKLRTMDVHAKVLVCDDWALVSSFNFLGQDPSWRSAHELGVRVFDAAVVDELWARLFAAGDDDASGPVVRSSDDQG